MESASRFVVDAATIDDVLRLGADLGAAAAPGTVVGLIGPLGAGKTTFVRGVAHGCGVADERMVTSPTFVLMHEYDGRMPIVHIDSYRLKRPDEFLDLALEESIDAGSLCLVEWADRVEEYLPPERITMRFEVAPGDRRRITIDVESLGPKSLIDEWRRRWNTRDQQGIV